MIQPMNIVWDERKRKAHLKKHGLDFTDARQVFAGSMVVFEDDREAYGEQRMLGIGALGVLVVVLAHTEDNETIRIFSMRKAEKHEEDRYYREIGA